MITSDTKEIHARVVRVHDFVLGPIEDGVVDREHGGDGEDLLNAFVSEKRRKRKRGLVSKETVVLRRWGVETNVWFSKAVDN